MVMRIALPSRRRFLTTAVATAAASTVDGIARPYISRAADRPVITHGIQSGDVSVDSGVVWARADRPSRMLVEIATTESFKNIRHAVFVDALPETDFAAKALIENLPSGQDIFYRISFQDLFSPTIVGEPMVGRFRTAPGDQRSISFIWSGDTAGQGWGIDESTAKSRTGPCSMSSCSTCEAIVVPTARTCKKAMALMPISLARPRSLGLSASS